MPLENFCKICIPITFFCYCIALLQQHSLELTLAFHVQCMSSMQLALKSKWPWQGAAVGGQYCNHCQKQGSIFQLRYCRVNIAAVIGCNYCLAPNPLHSNMDIGPGGIPLGTIIWFILQQCTSSEQQLEHLCCNILTSHNELIVHDGDTRT